jgi:hypothetical protein
VIISQGLRGKVPHNLNEKKIYTRETSSKQQKDRNTTQTTLSTHLAPRSPQKDSTEDDPERETKTQAAEPRA